MIFKKKNKKTQLTLEFDTVLNVKNVYQQKALRIFIGFGS